jgi:hypothetical protein
LLLASVLTVQPLRAQESPPELQVTLAEGCPEASHFHERLRVLSADRPLQAAGQVRVLAEAEGFRLEVETRDVRRTLRHASCAKLVESAAVIVALGAAAAEEPEASVEPAPVPPPPPPAQPSLPAAPAHHEAPRPLWLRASAEASGVWGLVPGLTVRPALGFGMRGARLGGALSVDYAAPRSTTGAEGVRVHGPGASLLATAVLHARVHVGLGADMHLLWGRGRGVGEARTQRVALWAGRLELVAVPLVLGRTSVGLLLAVAVPFHRPGFVFADGATAFRPHPYQLLCGVRFSFEARR